MSIILMNLPLKLRSYGKNVQSMLKLGRAQGAAIAAALTRSLPIFEYAPRKIKMSITGQGAASKEQVAAMLMNILKFRHDRILNWMPPTDWLLPLPFLPDK